MTQLRKFVLVPAAAANDPNWDLAPNQGEVTVIARSPADARIVAAAAEPDFRDRPAMPADGNSTRFASAFRNEKLYSVRELDDHVGDDARREVLSGAIDQDILKTRT